MGRSASNPSRQLRGCENCGKNTPRGHHLRLIIYPDSGGSVAVAGEVCGSCAGTSLRSALQAKECGETGRYEVFCFAICKPLVGGTYGRETTAEEKARPAIVTDEERGTKWER